MRRTILLLAALLVLAGPAPAPAQQPCTKKVAAKGKKWLYQGSGGVGCRFMREATKDFVRDRKEPKGWKCERVRKRGTCEEKGRAPGLLIFYVAPRKRN